MLGACSDLRSGRSSSAVSHSRLIICQEVNQHEGQHFEGDVWVSGLPGWLWGLLSCSPGVSRPPAATVKSEEPTTPESDL